MTRHIPKPWGYETIWAHQPFYVGKFIHIKEGHQLSLQKHLMKHESICVLKGKMRLHIALTDDDHKLTYHVLGPGDSWDIAPGTLHRFEAIDETDLVEVSTPYLDDIVRVKDDYGREDHATSKP